MQRLMILFAGLIAIGALAACSPPPATSTIEGRVCTTWGAQACSLEPGNPRAECSGSNWRIVEYCLDRGCHTLPSMGMTLAYCGDTPPTGNDVTSPGDAAPKDSGAPDAAKLDAASSDSSSGGAVQCNGWTCPAGMACSGFGGCEYPGCLPPCHAGQRCLGAPSGTCSDACSGACFNSQWCAPAGADALGTCQAMSCNAPSFGDVRVVEALTLLEGAAAASRCGHLPGASGALLSLTKLFGEIAAPTAEAAASGVQTYALVTLPTDSGHWGWLSARRKSGDGCGAGVGCPVVASKYDNLTGTCAVRASTQSAAEWPLSVRSALYRYGLSLSKVALQMSADKTKAWVCGAVTAASLRAGLSSAQAATTLARPSDAVMATVAAPDVDSNGDGKADAWSAVLELSLVPGQLSGWTP